MSLAAVVCNAVHILMLFEIIRGCGPNKKTFKLNCHIPKTAILVESSLPRVNPAGKQEV
jgi:hypothetical protein